MTLDELRQEIDRLDAQIVELLKQRMQCVHSVGEIKKGSNSHIFVPERESKLFAKLMANNAGVLPEKGLQSVYRQIVSMSFALEGGMKVGYLGPEGTWSHQAAQSRFGDSVELVPFPSSITSSTRWTARRWTTALSPLRTARTVRYLKLWTFSAPWGFASALRCTSLYRTAS